jgi:hypothetical protein
MAKDTLKRKQAKKERQREKDEAAAKADGEGGEGGGTSSDSAPTSASELLEALDHIRDGGFMDNTRLLKLAQIFSDDVTLDNAPRPQLVQVRDACTEMGITEMDIYSMGILQ